MEYILSLNKESKDKRVVELARICAEKGIKVVDNADFKPKIGIKSILFLEPRSEMPKNAGAYTYVFGYSKVDAKNYICLSDDEKFIEENNYLTALAMQEILDKRFGISNPKKRRQKVLIMGWGKLTAQLERVLTDVDIHILNFNHHKIPELIAKYGDKAFFEKVDFSKFPVIINTIPKQVIGAASLPKKSVVYELASPPYGVDFSGFNVGDYDYNIEPALPGRYYPDKAAQVVFDAIKRFVDKEISRPTVVLCVTGSSCSYLKLLPILKNLVEKYDVIPVLSVNANLPNRFVDIEKFREDLRAVCGHNIITTIAGAETLSANKRIVASVVFPATGNTVAKLANAVTDTCVTMAVKALLRNAKPCIIGISTNDGLSGNAANIGTLLNRKHYYFIPFSQDDPANKPYSLVCDFSKLVPTIDAALCGKQLQPIIS